MNVRFSELEESAFNEMIGSAKQMEHRILQAYPSLAEDRDWVRAMCCKVAMDSFQIRDGRRGG